MSRQQAIDVARGLTRKTGRYHKVYRCKDCGFWHVK